MVQTQIAILFQKNIRIYKQGVELDKQRVYLCMCPVGLFEDLPWDSKEIYQEFDAVIGEEKRPYVHVCVSKSEWDSWMAQEEEMNHETVIPATATDDDEEDEDEAEKEKKLQQRILRLMQEQILKILRAKLAAMQKEEKEKLKQSREKEEEKKEQQPDILNWPKAADPIPLAPDPNIETYIYDLSVEIFGSVQINTQDLSHHVRVGPGKFTARLDANGWIMIRVEKNEYGLLRRQWSQYFRGDKDMPFVKIGKPEQLTSKESP